MNYHRCDAYSGYGRCRCNAYNTAPCGYFKDATKPNTRVVFRDVHLCDGHSDLADHLRTQNKRLRLHHGGWFGAYNRHAYGNVVVDREKINWDKVKKLKIPKYWSKQEEIGK